MDGEPDARRVGARPLDPMALARRNEDVITRLEMEGRPVGERELGLADEERHPLVTLLREPEPELCRVARGDDALDENLASAREPLEELVRRRFA